MSNAVDWSKAPDKASCYADGRFWNYLQGYNEWLFFNGVRWELDCEVRSPDNFADYQPRPAPQEKPMKYEYGVEYPTNGKKPELPDDVLVEYKNMHHGNEWLKHAFAVGGLVWQDHTGDHVTAFRIVDERYKPAETAQEEPKPQNQYQRTIIGLDGLKCVVDVYRVLDAFKTDSPPLDHAIKKILCPGLRHAKTREQDLKEAIKSIEAELLLMSQR